MNRRKAISGLGVLIGGSMIGSPLYSNTISKTNAYNEKNDKSVRKKVVLTDNWRFQIDVKDIGERDQWFGDNYDRSIWGKVSQVPQAWDCYEDALWEYEGVGWYSTTINPDDFIVGKRAELIFNRVMYYSKVWLNGESIGENIGGYLPFSFDVTKYLKPGKENKLVVRVDNKPRIEWLPAAEQIEWIQYGGLLEPVELVSSSHIYIEDFTIVTIPEKDKAQVNCTVNIVNQTDALSDMELNIVISRGTHTINKRMKFKCKPNQSTKIDIGLSVEHADLWSPDNPALYKATVSLEKENIIIDDLVEQFGIRKVSVEGTSILLNGEPIIIKGAHRYDAMGRFGPTPPEKLVREDLALMKSVGINMIRVHYPQAPSLISLFDEYGFFMMEEIPLNWWKAKNTDILKQAKSSLTKMIKRDKNHPCIIIWSMANECATNTEAGIFVMRDLLKQSKAMDPTRLASFVAANSPIGHLGYDEANIVCFNTYEGSIGGKKRCEYIKDINSYGYKPTVEKLADIRNNFTSKPILITEFGAQGIKGIHGDIYFSEEFQSAYIKRIWEGINDVPGISGGILWCWADYFHRKYLITYTTYGPYGVVTGDRKYKKSLDALTLMYGGKRSIK
jgi:beta-glucuronidase